MIHDPMQPKSGFDLSITRLLNAPPDRVFAAWTRPALIRQWWKAKPELECLICEVDLRVGGRYRIGMGTAEPQYIATGEYVDIVPYSRLVMTWRWELPADGVQNTLLSIELEPVGRQTQLTLTHANLTSPKSVQNHRGGWEACIHNLAGMLAVASQPAARQTGSNSD